MFLMFKNKQQFNCHVKILSLSFILLLRETKYHPYKETNIK
jgi:hypothetical protein